MADPVTVDYVTDWAARLKSRLYTQFASAESWQKWVTLLAKQFQDLEDSAQTMFTLLDIDNSAGVQLDIIGRIVGQPRAGVSDTTYRIYLKARIAANRSAGGPEDIYDVFAVLFPTKTLLITTSAIGVKVFTLQLDANASTSTPASDAAIALTFLSSSKEAGARAILQWHPAPAAQLFTFDSGPGFDVGVFAGAKQA